MSRNRADVRVVQAMVDTMVGIEKFSYPAREQGAEKPKGEFAHIRLLEEYQVGLPNQKILSQDENTTTYRTISPARLRFRIGIIDSSGIAASKIMHGWTSEAMKELMKSTGYGFISCHPLSNEDAKLEKEWELRSGFSVEMYCTRILDETVNNITSVVINGAFNNDNIEEVLLTYEINEN